MREIKFRAWSIDGKEWVTPPKLTDELYATFGVCADVELMQYTGLKDKNGKEIYEKDILQARDTDGNGVGKYVIDWDHVRYRMKNVNGDDGVVWFNSPYIEVVGNVYENPELIK